MIEFANIYIYFMSHNLFISDYFSDFIGIFFTFLLLSFINMTFQCSLGPVLIGLKRQRYAIDKWRGNGTKLDCILHVDFECFLRYSMRYKLVI